MAPDSAWPEWFREEDEQVFAELRDCLSGEDEEQLRKALKLLRFQRNLFPDASARAILRAAGFPLATDAPRVRVEASEPPMPAEDSEPQVLRWATPTPSETFGPALAKAGVGRAGERPTGLPSWAPFVVVCLAALSLLCWAAIRRSGESRPPIQIDDPESGAEVATRQDERQAAQASVAEARIRALLGVASRLPAAQRQPLLTQVEQRLRQVSDLPDTVHWRLAGTSRLLAGEPGEALSRFARARDLGCRSRELWLGMHQARLLLGHERQADQLLRDGLADAFDAVLWRTARERGALSGQRKLLRKLAESAIEPAELLAAELSGDAAELRALMTRVASRHPDWLERSDLLARAWVSVQKE